MPLIGFEITDEKGEKRKISLLEAVKNPELTRLPVMTLLGIVKTSQFRGKSISATTLTNCRRRTYWERVKDYFANPSGLLYKSFRGTIVHAIMEMIAKNDIGVPGEDGFRVERAIKELLGDFVTEKRYYKDFPLSGGGTIPVSGQIDLYQISKREVTDYKSSEPYPVIKASQEGFDEAKIFQQNFYKWISPSHLPVEKLRLVFLGYGFTATSGKETEIKDKWGKLEKIRLPEVPILDEKLFLEMAEPRIREMDAAFNHGGPLPEGTPGRNGWLCRDCSFTKECDAYVKPAVWVGKGAKKEARPNKQWSLNLPGDQKKRGGKRLKTHSSPYIGPFAVYGNEGSEEYPFSVRDTKKGLVSIHKTQKEADITAAELTASHPPTKAAFDAAQGLLESV